MKQFNQLCVWPATIVGKDNVQAFNDFMRDEFGVRSAYECEVELADGRNDLLFFIHNDDVMKFAVKRLEYGIRWWEDVFYNNQESQYPHHITQKYKKTW